MIWILLIVLVVIIYFIVKPYVISYDTVLLFTGGLGSGKSLLSSQYALRLLRKNRWKVRFHNFNPKNIRNKWPKPMLYSSIPFKVSKKESAYRLTADHLLLRKAIVPRSVCFLDELDSFANQFDFKLDNILDNFNEYCRLYRHYTKGGYLVTNTQASDNCVLQIRRRINTCLNLMHFKKWFFLFYSVKIRNISLSEELKTIEEGNTEDNMSTKFGILPLFFRHYDTYCYSGRYDTVPFCDEEVYARLKTNVLLTCPRKKVTSLTNKEDPSETVAAPPAPAPLPSLPANKFDGVGRNEDSSSS